ncbi:putative Homeobox transcription factor [Taphrina deformans PYCC 5710]|uniref:Homeobox transcription factor n=1 Tax=Taphrina deformans (strain PYCC 5710 / ATCC 11124 / CBS 356.35 / IMI 108563 / JCM 9778 / NBRC 8474) TaxID=1097556 RepID=R4ZYK1_TAPDE|nr:putative Homeobox transcription factor [Taphrina deformans PYCC 5710]|eukprot:CCX35411.1 putative Homeobox transcription factor [Taphrina deformans PYCC 5710]
MHNGLRPYEPLQSPRIGLPYHHEEAPPMNYRDNTYGGTFSANGYLNHNAPAATSPIEYSQRRPSLPTAAQHHATPYDRQVSTGGFHPPVPSSQSHSYSQPGQQVYQEYTMGDASKPKRRRGNLPKSTTALLRTWLYDHTNHPYPSEDEKNQLAAQTGLMINQISNWFINARRRILQPSDMQKGLMQQSHASQNGSVQSTASQPRIHNAASQGPYVSQPRSPSQHASSVVLQPPYER